MYKFNAFSVLTKHLRTKALTVVCSVVALQN